MNAFHVTLANGKTFPALAGQTLLEAAEAAGLALPHSCRRGRCGACVATPVAGQSRARHAVASGMSVQMRPAGTVLTCQHEAASDMQLDVTDVQPGEPVRIHPCRVDALRHLAPDVLGVRLRLPPNACFRYRAGQSVDVIGPQGLKRTYSIAAAPALEGESAHLELHVRAVPHGAMSNYWFGQARVNDLLRLQGPQGTFFLGDTADQDVVFLATGTGIAPAKAMLEELNRCPQTHRPRSTRLFWGGRVPGDLYWDPRECGSDVDFVPVLSRAGSEWRGGRGHVQDVFLAKAGVDSRTVVYACGSPTMIATARNTLAAAGLSASRFHYDAFVASS